MQRLFRCRPSEIGKEQRLMYIAIRTDDVGKLDGIKIPCEATVRSVMEQINLIHKPKRKPNGITKADREARKSDDLLKRDFTADAPLEKAEQLYIPIGAASIQVLRTELLFKNTALFRA